MASAARVDLDGNPIKPITICMIGAGGFIGSHLCEKLMAETPHKVLAVDVYKDKIKHLLEPASLPWSDRIQFHRINIKNDSRLEGLIKMADLTINLAAICTPADYNTRPLDTIYSNFIDALPVVGKHDKMGLNVVPLKQLTPKELKVMTLDLLKNMDPNDAQNGKSRGQIVLELMYKPFTDEEMPKETEDSNAVEKAPEGTPDGGGLLAVIVHEAQDLEGKHHTNPQVRLLFRGEERRTKPVKKNRDPRWEEEFQFTLDEPPTNDRIHVEVVSTSSRMGLLHPKCRVGFCKTATGFVSGSKML